MKRVTICTDQFEKGTEQKKKDGKMASMNS